MKTLRAFYILVVSFSFLNQAYAQCSNTSARSLQANQIKAIFSSNGNLFSDGGFAVPYTPGVSQVQTMQQGSLVLAGIDQSGEIRASVGESHSLYPYSDFMAGPLHDDTSQALENGCANFNQIWQVYRFEIMQFLNDFQENGKIDDVIPLNIRSWPGRGNPFFKSTMGFDLPDQDLAPFFDRNGNNRYEPKAGEYPIIGEDMPDIIPDHLLWAVFNDQGDERPNTDAKMGIEVHLIAYGFNCTDNESLSKTVFTRHKIIMKGAAPIHDFIAGYWVDPNLGCDIDDYLGTDTLLNTVYIYNQDELDGDDDCQCPNDFTSYCDQPPVQAITVLNTSMWRSMVFTGGFLSIVPGEGEPVRSLEFYDYLQGIWRDGSPLVSRGNGHDYLNPDEPTRFAFFDDPSNPEGWSMYAENLQSADIRSIFSFAPRSFNRGESMTIDLAFSFHQEPGASHLGNVQVMQQELPFIQNAYANAFNTACAQVPACELDCIWPGDADHNGRVDKDDILAIGVAVGQNASSEGRFPNFMDWIPQNASDWPMEFPDGTNYKHADGNGDGIVTPLDKALVDKHYGKTIPGNEVPEDQIALNSEIGLRLENNAPKISNSPPYLLPRSLRTKIFLGTETNPIEGLYGIAFTVLFDPELMEPSANLPVIREVFDGFLDASSNTISKALLMPEKGRIDLSICKTDGQAFEGWGEVGEFWLQLRQDIRTPNPDSTEPVIYQVANLKAVDLEGNLLNIGARGDTTLAVDLIFDPIPRVDDLPVGPDYFIVSPNPNQGTLFLELINPRRDEEVGLSLLNMQSQVMMHKKLVFNDTSIQLDLPAGLSKGLYLVVLETENGRQFVHKLVLND